MRAFVGSAHASLSATEPVQVAPLPQAVRQLQCLPASGAWPALVDVIGRGRRPLVEDGSLAQGAVAATEDIVPGEAHGSSLVNLSRAPYARPLRYSGPP